MTERHLYCEKRTLNGQENWSKAKFEQHIHRYKSKYIFGYYQCNRNVKKKFVNFKIMQ